jgi:uncharacterized protein
MVSVNVSQLLLAGPGTVREFDFSEPLPDPAGDLHLCGPIAGHARMMRTSEGILVHSEHVAPITIECARCLDEAVARVEGVLDEEFLPSTDIRTGLLVDLPVVEEDDQPRIDEHHEINLNEVLRQNILTNLPMHPLCSASCPGLCATCGQRLDDHHAAHPELEPEPDSPPVDPASPFARLAVLLKDDQER